MFGSVWGGWEGSVFRIGGRPGSDERASNFAAAGKFRAMLRGKTVGSARSFGKGSGSAASMRCTAFVKFMSRFGCCTLNTLRSEVVVSSMYHQRQVGGMTWIFPARYTKPYIIEI
ncbi:MAG: hypothetical protein Q6365_022105 [Candidatus Sigynarchaeota archaeon]